MITTRWKCGKTYVSPNTAMGMILLPLKPKSHAGLKLKEGRGDLFLSMFDDDLSYENCTYNGGKSSVMFQALLGSR